MSEQMTTSWEAGSTDAPLPPLVDSPDMQSEEQPFVMLYRNFGPIFRLSQPDEKTLIILVGPEANAFMARHEDEFFTTREHWEKFDTTISQGKSGMSEARDGEANRKRRASSSRQWSRARILEQIPDMIGITQECSQNWQVDKGIAVHASMRRIVSEQLGRLLIGYSPGEYLDDFVTYLNTAIVNTLSDGKKAGESLESATYKRAVARVHEFGLKAYQAHLEHPQPTGKPDMIDEAIARMQNYPEEQRRAMLTGVAIGPMLAGIDTVANSLCFMTYALLKYPDILRRVQAEVDSAFADGPLTWEKIKQMPDLQGAMMETLRRFPVAGGHMAHVAQPFTFAGYRLEPGDDVRVAMTVPHFLEELYHDPWCFDIDRFREPRNEHRQRGAYAPFGLGNHTCLGAGIAEVQLMVTMATLLHTFVLQLDPPDYALTIEHHPTSVPGNNFQIKVVEHREA